MLSKAVVDGGAVSLPQADGWIVMPEKRPTLRWWHL